MDKDSSEKIKLAHVLGYALKARKNIVDISKFEDKFKAIRHGDYHEFIKLMKGTIEGLVFWEPGRGIVLPTVDNIEHEHPFVRLGGAGNSLEKFHNECVLEFGDIKDVDISEDMFRKVAVFEHRIRMHVKKYGKGKTNDLEPLINDLPNHFPLLTNEEVKKIHNGRKFLNMIKHYQEKIKKGKKLPFTTWSEGSTAFEEAYEILNKHKIQIF